MIIGSNVRFDEGSLGGRQPLEIAQELEEEPNEGDIEKLAEINDSGQGKFQASEILHSAGYPKNTQRQ